MVVGGEKSGEFATQTRVPSLGITEHCLMHQRTSWSFYPLPNSLAKSPLWYGMKSPPSSPTFASQASPQPLPGCVLLAKLANVSSLLLLFFPPWDLKDWIELR